MYYVVSWCNAHINKKNRSKQNYFSHGNEKEWRHKVRKHALLNSAVKDCVTLKIFLLDFKPVDWWTIFVVVSLGDTPGMHTHNPVHFSYEETLKIEWKQTIF